MAITDPRSPVEELLLRGHGLPEAARHGAETYFTDQRADRGERHVRLCTGTGCFAATQGRQIADVESALGVTVGHCADDGSVSLQAAHCLGYCYAGPAALDGVEPRVGPTLVDQLNGRADSIDPGMPAVAVSPPVVLRGIVGGEPSWQVWPTVVSRPDGGETVRREVGLAGLRGRGGAGFPTAAKWDAVRSTDDMGQRFVVANGDEGDPGSFADRLLMERDPDRVLEGLALAGLACRATAGFVYVRSEYPRARAILTRAVESARAAGHLGSDIHGSGVDFDVTVVSGHGSYVAGEETSLLRSMAGLRGTVRVRPPYPTESGFLGCPTAVNNVETLAAVPAILADGGAAYARLGQGPETGTLLVCLTERFARPGAYEVELGIPLRHIVEELGGGLRDGGELRAVQVGGPLGGFLAPVQLDLPLLEAALAGAGVSLGHGSLVAIDSNTSHADLLAHLWQFGADESCGACTPCREGTRRGAADPGASSRDPALLDLMSEASLCAFGRRLPAAVRSLMAIAPWS
jgi:bidirectional [NiFe] hydrogenase diaphorase subunit